MYRQKRRSRNRRKEVYLKVGKEKPENLLKKLYLSYYSIDPVLLLPTDIQFREFAFQPWGSKSYVRHLSFNNIDELRKYLKEKIPLHVYHSIALYELPEAPKMEEKGFLGAELLFDIDADHLPGCENRFDDYCLIKAAEEAGRLIKIIRRDLDAEVFPYFTGNRGFHVRAWCDNCLRLGRDERRMIADYVTARNINIEMLFPKSKKRLQPARPSSNDPGWRGWIGKSLEKKLRNLLFLDNKRGEVKSLPQLLGKEWKDELLEIVGSEAIKIDLQVTQDISRLTRIPGTLNGKASMLVTYVEDPLNFTPSKELSPFSGELEVKVLKDYEGKLLGEKLVLKKGEEIELSADTAVVLITKGLINPMRGEIVVRESSSWRALQDVRWPPRVFEFGTSS